MKFDGIQKLTLLDYPGQVACTLFFGGCDFRCPFCHNASLVLAPEGTIGEEEILAFLRRRRGVLDGVCVTGGEPLLQSGLLPFLRQVRSLGYLIKLDTNGSFPDRLKAAVSSGLLDYVAMDIKNSLPRYAQTAGLEKLDTAPVEESVRFLLSGAVDCEFRTTVVKPLHDEDSFREIGRWIAGAKRYFLQSFVDSGDLIGSGLSAFSREEMEKFRAICLPFVPSAQLRGV